MRYIVMLLLLAFSLLVSVPPACSQSLEPQYQASVDEVKTDRPAVGWANTTFDLSAGYRRDKLNWNIAGNPQGRSPNVRSELSWSDLNIFQLKLANRTVIKDRFYIRGHLDYGTVSSGSNRDSDYNGDDRTQEFSRSLNGVNGNDVWDASIGIGPRFSFFNATMAVCPMLGYAISDQDLNIVDGYQAFAAPPASTPIGPIDGLDSRYQTRWKGPWLGLDLLLSAPCTDGPITRIGVLFTGEYHWVDFNADANWNLRADYQHPVSFSHEADGSGFVAGAKILFEIKNHWGINVGMNVQEMTTDPGQDSIYYADGTTADTRLNEVKWHSFTFEAGLSYQF